MMGWDYTMNGWMSAWMWIPMILVVALLILGTIAVARGLSNGTPRESDDPLAIAARRFARGDINKDEYETLRATLSR
jgi:putative membrane protein